MPHHPKKKHDPKDRRKNKFGKASGLNFNDKGKKDDTGKDVRSRLKKVRRQQELKKKFTAAAAPPPKTAQEKLWDFWFDLQKAAARKDWKTVERKLAANKTAKLTHHRFTMQLFEQAALAGKLPIVEEMFKRKFTLPRHEGYTLMERLAKKSHANLIGPNDDVIPVIAFLAKNKHAPAERALQHLIAEGTTLQIADLKNAGVDIHLGGNSFAIAFHAGNTSMMAFLYHNDANIYTPAVIAGLHSGLSSHRGRPMDDERQAETIAAYRKMVADDAYSLQLYYGYCCPEKRSPTLDDFREVPGGCTESEWTLLHLAARAGDFADVAEAALAEKKNPLRADDLLRPDKKGVTPLAILAARGEEHLAFAHTLWRHDPAEAIKLNAALKDMRAAEAIDVDRFATEVRQRQLQEMARDGRWSLHPEKKPGAKGAKPGVAAP